MGDRHVCHDVDHHVQCPDGYVFAFAIVDLVARDEMFFPCPSHQLCIMVHTPGLTALTRMMAELGRDATYQSFLRLKRVGHYVAKAGEN